MACLLYRIAERTRRDRRECYALAIMPHGEHEALRITAGEEFRLAAVGSPEDGANSVDDALGLRDAISSCHFGVPSRTSA